MCGEKSHGFGDASAEKLWVLRVRGAEGAERGKRGNHACSSRRVRVLRMLTLTLTLTLTSHKGNGA